MRSKLLTSPGLAVALTLLAGCAPSTSSTGAASSGTKPAPWIAAATVAPLGSLLADVAGDRWTVRVLIPPGRSPHDYEPSPGDLKTLASARFLFRVGHPSFTFEERLLLPLAQRPKALEVLSLADLGAPAVLGEDPHPWLSPPLLETTARALGESLAKLDPEAAADYRRRAAAKAELFRALDGELARILDAGGCRTFLVDHPAWGAFAAHYGLHQLAIEREGKDPGPATLARTVEAARAAGLRLLLVRPGRPAARSLSVARSLGAETAELDPLAPDLEANLRRAAELVAGGCRHD